MNDIFDTVKQFLETCDKRQEPKSLEKYIGTYIMGISDAYAFCTKFHYAETIQEINSIVSDFMSEVYEGYVHCGKNAGETI